MWLLGRSHNFTIEIQTIFTQYKFNLGYVSMKSYLKQYLWGFLYEIS